MTGVVADASALVALFIDDGPDGQWAAQELRDATLEAPHLLPFEVANILRREVRVGRISGADGAQAHDLLIRLPVRLWTYDAVAQRVWELRDNLTSYDAAYVAVAEFAGATLATLDGRLAHAPGPRCPIVTPDDRRSRTM